MGSRHHHLRRSLLSIHPRGNKLLFNVMFVLPVKSQLSSDEYFRQKRARDVEREELDEENAPGMDSVERRDDDGRCDAEGRQLLATICADRKRCNASQRPQAHPLPQYTQQHASTALSVPTIASRLRLMIFMMFQSRLDTNR